MPPNARLTVDGQGVDIAESLYLMLNKPRGLVTTRQDEQGRDTVYQCFGDAFLSQHPWIAPVGRLDKASEGLLLFTNDSRWAAQLLDPRRHCNKVYCVQTLPPPTPIQLQQCLQGVSVDGEIFACKAIRLVRQNLRTAWVEITLDEGKNRHIRRMLSAVGLTTERLIRTQIGDLVLGNLAKGQYRFLTVAEQQQLIG